jgi:hypothetical protein
VETSLDTFVFQGCMESVDDVGAVVGRVCVEEAGVNEGLCDSLLPREGLLALDTPTLRYYVGRYERNVRLLVRGWWFRLVAVYPHEQLVGKIIQVIKLRCKWWRPDGSAVVPCWVHVFL